MRCAVEVSLIAEGAIMAGAEDLLLMRCAVKAPLTAEGVITAVTAAANVAAAGMEAGVVVGVVNK